MAPSESIASEMGQDETDDELFDQGFPDHDIRKQAFFKLVTEQMNRARKVLDFHDLPVATRYRSGLNAITTFDKVTLDVSSDKEQGEGDNGADVDGTHGNCDTLTDSKSKLESVVDNKKADVKAVAKRDEVLSPNVQQLTEEIEANPLKCNDEYKLSLVSVLNCLLAELGLLPLSIIVSSSPDEMKSERPTKVNRRMPWTMSQQYDSDDAGSVPSIEEESSGDEASVGGGDFIPEHRAPGLISVIFFFLLVAVLFEMMNYFAAYLDTVEWPWTLWDRLLNLSLLHNFIQNTVPNPWGMWRVQNNC